MPSAIRTSWDGSKRWRNCSGNRSTVTSEYVPLPESCTPVQGWSKVEFPYSERLRLVGPIRSSSAAERPPALAVGHPWVQYGLQEAAPSAESKKQIMTPSRAMVGTGARWAGQRFGDRKGDQLPIQWRTRNVESDQGKCWTKAARTLREPLRYRRLVPAPDAGSATHRQAIGRVDPSDGPES